MARPVAYALQDFPEHSSIIGGMLLSYANLEFFMVVMLGDIFGKRREGMYQAARILYRLRGANDRLQVADAFLGPSVARFKLAGAYSQWLGAMRACRIIRNRYAHCGWHDEDGCLEYMDFDAVGQEGTVLYSYPIDLPLLKEQEAYFDYAFKLSLHLAGEIRYRTDRRRTRNRCKLPKSRAVPKPYSPRDAQTAQARG